MSSLRKLYAILAPLRLYALGRGSAVDCELSAYGAALDILDRAVCALAAGAHPQTAAGEALDLHEAAVGLPRRSGVSDEARRELILRRLAGPFPPDRAGVEEALAACGLIRPQIFERPAGIFVSAAGVVPGLSLDECWRLCLRALPAHLPAFMDGQSWDERDALRLSWDQLDALELSWTQIAFGGVG
ncbi:MAG: hypothetical protein FWE32_10775 [Oscillospiraceae bacterium]|nr:hypothetical protein [Oscillospiraceae bacterium]